MLTRYLRKKPALTALGATITSATRAGSLALVLGLASLTMMSVQSAQAQTPPDPTVSETRNVQNQVNINTADAETLALALDGIGMSKARDIIAHREQHGAFNTVDDLQNVRGVGKATLERNRDRILVDVSEE